MTNRQQQTAITHGKGPCMVLAGPGSGKTYTVTRRIEYLIKTCKVRPEEILVITFTRAAAKQMKERFTDIMPTEGRRVTFGTFHGIYYGILKWAYRLQADCVLSEEEKGRILQDILIKESADRAEDKEWIKDLLTEISRVKNNGEYVKQYVSSCCSKKEFQTIYNAYEEKRLKLGKLDFDDMLVETKRLFTERQDILKLWQEKYTYILVDEFQDINLIQYEILKLLALPQDNLFVVGDDDQSVYGFRGARPDLMFQFTKDYPGASMCYLETNYRSTRAIVQVAGKVIAQNRHRFEKTIRTDNEQGETVHVQELFDPTEESRYVINCIRKYLREGVAPERMAVLFRSSVDAGLLAELCMQEQVPFAMKDRFFNLYEHCIGRDLIAYLRLSCGERRRGDFLRVMNRPNRYIGRNAVDKSSTTFEDLRKYYEDADWMQERIDRFETDVKLMGRMAPYAAIRYIRKSIGYDLYLREYAVMHQIREEELFDILSQIEERAKAYKDLASWFSHIDEYTRMLRLQAKEKQEKKNAVSLMTMHGSKGLEFDIVFVIGANEGVTPYKKAKLDKEIEEERRMFYVAMTRAKKKLIISYTKEKNGKPVQPSRFVDEILMETGTIRHS